MAKAEYQRMHWYDRYKYAAGEDAPWNWGRFGRSLIGSIGFFGSVMALMLYFNMPRPEAERAVRQQPQQVEQALRQIPPQVIQQAVQMAQQQPSQPLPPQVQQQAQQPQMQHASPFSLISPAIVRDQIADHEGRESIAYADTLGNMTVGVGFNLERPDARTLLSQIGADYDLVKAKKQALTDEQIDRLFDVNLREAFQVAQNYIPDLGTHPPEAQRVIVDMAYNVGPTTLGTMKSLRAAIMRRDYNAAASVMEKMKWYRQVARRGPNLVNLMRQAAVRAAQSAPQQSPGTSPASPR